MGEFHCGKRLPPLHLLLSLWRIGNGDCVKVWLENPWLPDLENW